MTASDATSLARDRALAQAAAQGDRAALLAFELQFRDELRRTTVRLGAGAETDELVQILLVRILVGTGDAPPKIAGYRGEGSLRAWVRAVATRFVIDHLRGAQARPQLAELPELAVPRSLDLEGGLEQQRFTALVRTALDAAFAELTPRQRNLLRHAVFGAMTIDELGSLYRVHRTTAARWLQRAREDLQTAMTAKLAATGGMSDADARSLLRRVGVDTDVSLRSVLSLDAEHDSAIASG